jgi:hypothetical protein
MSCGLLLIWIGESPYRYDKFPILLQSNPIGTLIRVVSNLVSHHSFWVPDWVNIYGTVTNP